MKICIDMDGVVTDFSTRALKMAKKKLGIEVDYKDVTNTKMADFIFEKMTEEQKKEFKVTKPKDLYDILCPRNFFRLLKPYKGARKAVTDLIEAGHHVIFVTKPLNWKYSSEEKEDWLRWNIIVQGQRTYDPAPYSLFMVRKMEDKCLVDADVYIDDDPRVLGTLETNKAICIEQPWNQEYRDKTFEGKTFKSLAHAVKWIFKNEEWLSHPDNGGLDASESK
jgi:5'(3')-deoxyribonucleotidase